MIKKNRAYFHFFILVKDVELNFWTVQSVDGVLEKQGKKKKKKKSHWKNVGQQGKELLVGYLSDKTEWKDYDWEFIFSITLYLTLRSF
jgi:hypothetical protein